MGSSPTWRTQPPLTGRFIFPCSSIGRCTRLLIGRLLVRVQSGELTSPIRGVDTLAFLLGLWAVSSIGRAPVLHTGGYGFKSRTVHVTHSFLSCVTYLACWEMGISGTSFRSSLFAAMQAVALLLAKEADCKSVTIMVLGVQIPPAAL